LTRNTITCTLQLALSRLRRCLLLKLKVQRLICLHTKQSYYILLCCTVENKLPSADVDKGIWNKHPSVSNGHLWVRHTSTIGSPFSIEHYCNTTISDFSTLSLFNPSGWQDEELVIV
jgi:hypothetical protein